MKIIKFKEYLNETEFRWTKDMVKFYETDFEECKWNNYLELDAQGVIVGEPLTSQKNLKRIYPCFEKTRNELKKKFGNTLTFYRVDINLDHPDNERFKKIEKNIKVKLVTDSKYDLKIWKDWYKKDLDDGIRKVVSITIPTDDVLAIYRKPGVRYREIHILTKNAKYKVL